MQIALLKIRKLQPQCERLFSHVKMVQDQYATRMHVDTLGVYLRVLTETPDDPRLLDLEAIDADFKSRKNRMPLHFPDPKVDPLLAYENRTRAGRKKQKAKLKAKVMKHSSVTLDAGQAQAEFFHSRVAEQWQGDEGPLGESLWQPIGAQPVAETELTAERKLAEGQGADLEGQEAGLERQEADLEGQEADLEEQEADLERQEADLERQEADLEEQKVEGQQTQHHWEHVVGARKLSNGSVELMVLWSNGDCTLEAHADDYWAGCRREELLDFPAAQQPMILYQGRVESHGALDASNNGLHKFTFQYKSTKRGERGQIKHRHEIHDLLGLEMISAWVFTEHQGAFKTLKRK